MNRVMAVYDVDPFYADRFAEFVNRKETVPFTAVAFTSISRLKDFMERQNVELLLVGDEVADEQLEELNQIQVIRLSETGLAKDERPTVYKYQASDSVLREVMACYQVQVQEQPQLRMIAGKRCQVIGIYSPIGRCGKTSFAMTLGQIMAKDAKVLLLSLEEFSGLSALTGTVYSASLSDLIYHFRQGDYGRLRLGSVVYSWGGLDYVPPVMYAEDLVGVNGEEVAELMGHIAREGGYETLIIDMGHFTQGVEAVLSLCDIVYSPVKEDVVSATKIEEWKNYLQASGRENLWEKVRILKLPRQRITPARDVYLEQLLWGELGDYTRELAGGKGGFVE